jgi:hypothetical protein
VVESPSAIGQFLVFGGGLDGVGLGCGGDFAGCFDGDGEDVFVGHAGLLVLGRRAALAGQRLVVMEFVGSGAGVTGPSWTRATGPIVQASTSRVRMSTRRMAASVVQVPPPGT